MRPKFLFFLLLGSLLTLAACRKDLDVTNSSTIEDPVATYFRATLAGTVVNEAGDPVENATVNLTGTTMKTDKNGVFIFRNVVVKSTGAYVSVAHPDFFHGSRTVLMTPNVRTSVQIRLFKDSNERKINAITGGIADYGDYSISLPANGVVTSSGTTYSGSIVVKARWLDPTSRYFGEMAPGDFTGRRLDGSLSGMVSMGMVAVELLDGSGNKLQVKPGSEATIKMKVPNSMLAKAPAKIPLWSFDEVKGLWIEESEATLSGGFYEGNVKHFTFWNCDYPAPLIELKVLVKDAQGNPVANATVGIKLLPNGGIATGITDSSGCVKGKVPKNEPLELVVYSSAQQCQSPIFAQNIGPYSQNASVTAIITPSSNAVSFTLKGNVTDCSNNPMKNGYVIIQGGGNRFTAWTDSLGNYSYQFFLCQSGNQDLNLKAYDLTNLKESADISLTANPGINTKNISVCATLSELLVYTWPGGALTGVDPITVYNDSTPGGPVDYLTIQGQIGGGPSDQVYIVLTIKDFNGVGTYTPESFIAEGRNGQTSIFHQCNAWAGCTGLTVNVTKEDPRGSGGTIEGNWSGMVPDNSSQPPTMISVSGNFVVKN
jgi:protocatechuate 3,4-dioxygenase beta subunit